MLSFTKQLDLVVFITLLDFIDNNLDIENREHQRKLNTGNEKNEDEQVGIKGGIHD